MFRKKLAALAIAGLSHIADNPIAFFAVNGAIIGSGGWTRSRPRYANALGASHAAVDRPTVRSVFVDPAVVGRGIASTIMNRTERDALEHHVDTLHLTATLSGVALYEAFDYQTEEVTELRFPDQTLFGCVRMKKFLGKLRTQAA